MLILSSQDLFFGVLSKRVLCRAPHALPKPAGKRNESGLLLLIQNALPAAGQALGGSEHQPSARRWGCVQGSSSRAVLLAHKDLQDAGLETVLIPSGREGGMERSWLQLPSAQAIVL